VIDVEDDGLIGGVEGPFIDFRSFTQFSSLERNLLGVTVSVVEVGIVIGNSDFISLFSFSDIVFTNIVDRGVIFGGGR